MRDLFQVVFELKKKEIELARQQIQSKTINDLHHPLTLNIKGSINNGSITALTSSKVNNTEGAKAKVRRLFYFKVLSGDNFCVLEIRGYANLNIAYLNDNVSF